MKHYPKTYEDVASSPRSMSQCNINRVGNMMGVDTDEYIDRLRKSMNKYQLDLFDNLKKFYWLTGQYSYKGKVKSDTFVKGKKKEVNLFNKSINVSYGVFMKRYAKVDNRFIHNRTNWAIVSYLNDFFPDFYNRNPFEEEMKYPYKFMMLEFIVPVYQLPERIELLDYGETMKMSYQQFIDYVINHVNCKNDELDSLNDKKTERFVANKTHYELPYVFSKVKNLTY